MPGISRPGIWLVRATDKVLVSRAILAASFATLWQSGLSSIVALIHAVTRMGKKSRRIPARNFAPINEVHYHYMNSFRLHPMLVQHFAKEDK